MLFIKEPEHRKKTLAATSERKEKRFKGANKWFKTYMVISNTRSDPVKTNISLDMESSSYNQEQSRELRLSLLIEYKFLEYNEVLDTSFLL